MSGHSWVEVEAVFAEAVDLAPAERLALLDARCAGRPALRAEVESLLASHDGSDGFLHAATEGRGPSGSAPRPGEPGQVIGRFRLLERIGEGGMGVVYRGERADGEFVEQVAIKLIAAPLHDPEALRRFGVERQVLATLNHPDIVALVDGGVTAAGQPYLAMKYVDGVPITEYCGARQMTLEGRLRLFQRVCAAVQHAHQNGVVHRDLKPANILVTPEGLPKMLDFGIAKLLEAKPTAASDRTATAFLRPMTPNYASPEQLRGLPVTTACDVYALGVVLYELLAGVRPYDVSSQPLDVVLATVSECEPRRPSAAAVRSGRLPYDGRQLRGDLDAIVLKAMHKEPAHRYASARELADDIGRHLATQPILAREPSLAYVAAQLARRHRAAFVASAVAITALLVALGVSLWQTRVAIAERDRARARFDDARQLANALIFRIHDEVRPLPGSTPVRLTIVTEALTYLERLSADPAADAALRVELARGYHRVGEVQGNPNTPNLGDRDGALASLRKAVTLLEPLVTRDASDRAAALELGRALITFSRLARLDGPSEASLEATRKAVAIAEALAARDSRDRDARRLLGSAVFDLAYVDPPAVPHWQRAGEIFGSLLAEEPGNSDWQRNVALVEKYLGGHYQGVGDLAEALRHHGRALELDRRRAEAEPENRQAQLDLAIDLGNVAWIHHAAGRFAEAVATYEQSRDIRRRLAASDPKDDYARGRLAFVLGAMARSYSKLGRHSEALAHAREAAAISESRSRLDSQNRTELVDYLSTLAHVERAAGRLDTSCATARRAHDLSAQTGITAEKDRILAQVAEGLEACGSRVP